MKIITNDQTCIKNLKLYRWIISKYFTRNRHVQNTLFKSEKLECVICTVLKQLHFNLKKEKPLFGENFSKTHSSIRWKKKKKKKKTRRCIKLALALDIRNLYDSKATKSFGRTFPCEILTKAEKLGIGQLLGRSRDWCREASPPSLKRDEDRLKFNSRPWAA